MFFLMDTPNQKQFEDLAQRYERMDIPSVQALVKLLRTGSDLLTGFEKRLGTYGLSQGRFLILVILNRTPKTPLTPSGLAEKLGVTRATMTGLVTGLEKDQLITRQADSVDKRKIHIRLTAKGIQRLESILPDYYDRINSLMQGLSLNQKTTLISLLEIVDTGIPNLTMDKMDPQKNSIEIGSYTAAYQDQVIELILTIQQTEFNIPITAQDQPDLGDIPGFYQQGVGNFWVATHGSRVVGTLSLKDIGNGQAALRKMFVHPEFRGPGLGIAMALWGAALEWAGIKNISGIFLGTTEKFLAAHRFYEKNGFVPIEKESLPSQFPIMAVDTKFYAYSPG